MGFVGAQRASVGNILPGVCIQPLLLMEKVRSGGATSMMLTLVAFEYFIFDLLCLL